MNNNRIFVILISLLVIKVNHLWAKHMFGETTVFGNINTDDSRMIRKKNPNDERVSITMKGTKWCGPGNTASSYDDLGEHRDVDKCCRDHDHCDCIPSGESKNGLTNDDFFTRLHCDCDKAFYKCLHTINTDIANSVGKMYFSFRDKCYRDDYPIVECGEFDTAVYFVRRCIRYILDETQMNKYQWFDLPFYNGKQPDNLLEHDDMYADNNELLFV